MAASPPTSAAFLDDAGAGSRRVSTALRALGRGPVPLLAGLAAIWVLFNALNSNFLTARNLSNLVLQIAVLGVLALGMVLVLIIGEIDLSVGAIAGVSAAILAVLITYRGWPVWAAIAVALAAGAVIGLLHGLVIVTFAIPSFIVTLAGLLVWQGVQLAIVGGAGEIPIRDPFIRGIASTYLPAWLSWVLAGLSVGVVAWQRFSSRRQRVTAGLRPPAAWLDLAIVAGTAAALSALILLLSGYRGVPWVLVLVGGLVIGVSVLLRSYRFGAHLYAIGGNREAARRAGIRLGAVTLVVFAAVAMFAALAGVIEASRLFSVSNALGGGTLQLNAIAAVVICGTSLAGGRGRAYHALLGALVVGSVQNGLDLLGQGAAVKNIATGLMLILAVILDAVARRRRAAAGLGV